MWRKSLTTHWDQMSRDEIRSEQAKLLYRQLNEVVIPHSPYYRALFEREGIDPRSIKTLEDFQKVPFTTKYDLAPTEDRPKKPRDFIIQPDSAALKRKPSVIFRAITRGRATVQKELEEEFRPIFMTSTTGRSAEPIPFVYSKHDIRNLELAGYRMMEVAGVQKDWKILNMFPYAPHLGFWQVHYATTAYGVFNVGTGGGKTMGTAGNIRLLKKMQPDVLVGIPTFIYHVFQQAIEENLRCPNLKAIFLGGEKVEDGMRKKLRSMAVKLGAGEIDVLATYGFTEAKIATGECPFPHDQQSGGYHLQPDLGLVEVIDPDTGEVLEDGMPGEVVYTPLNARGSTVLRYRTGDFVEGGLTHEPCPHCGRGMPRLVGKISRKSNVKEMQLDKIKGTLVDFNELEHVLENMDHIGCWQLEIRKMNDDPLDLDELILHVERVDRFQEDRLRRQILERFSERVEVCPNAIEFHSMREMRELQGVGTKLKEEKIVDHRPDKDGNVPPRMGGATEPGFFRRIVNGFMNALGGGSSSPIQSPVEKNLEEGVKRR